MVEDQLEGCIIVAGKGYPDFATSRAVRHMHERLKLPVFGPADGDVYGVLILNTYRQIGISIQWLGIRPSQVDYLSSQFSLPEEVFLEVTDEETTRLASLLETTHPFHTNNPRSDELNAMRNTKVELEVLHWLGMDFCTQFVEALMDYALNPDDYEADETNTWMQIA